MSKSKGKRHSPSAYVESHGADAARCYILFLGPPEQDADWSDDGLGGVHRFLSRVWRLSPAGRPLARPPAPDELDGAALDLARKAHWAIPKVTSDIERFQFNTAIAALMELVNEIYRMEAELREDEAGENALWFAITTVASLLFPFAPHLSAGGLRADDRRAGLGGAVAALRRALPRARHRQGRGAGERQGARQHRGRQGRRRGRDQAAALERPKVQRHLDDRKVVREIVVPGKLVNFVIR